MDVTKKEPPMTLRNPHEQTEAFQPLGAPIRPEAPKPAASPAVVSPGIIRHADGTLGTAIPPPSAPAPVVRAMQSRDTVRPKAYMFDESIADYFSRQCRKLLAPTDPAAWPAYSKDYEAGYRDGYAAALRIDAKIQTLAETQAAAVRVSAPGRLEFTGDDVNMDGWTWDISSDPAVVTRKQMAIIALEFIIDKIRNDADPSGDEVVAECEAKWRAACAAPYHQQQAADWLTITKQVQDMPSK